MFAVRVSFFREAFQMFLSSEYCCDDESFVSLWPILPSIDNNLINGETQYHPHVIDMHFSVVHFAFKDQLLNYDGNSANDILSYYKLALRIYNQMNHQSRFVPDADTEIPEDYICDCIPHKSCTIGDGKHCDASKWDVKNNESESINKKKKKKKKNRENRKSAMKIRREKKK